MAWTSPRTWVAGETVTAALMNTHVRDNLKAVGDAWTAYTPTWRNGPGGSALSIGSGTLTGAYMQAGKLVHFRFHLIRAADTNLGSAAHIFDLPVAPLTHRGVQGSAFVLDASASTTGSLPHRYHGIGSSEIAIVGSGGRRIDNNGFGTAPTAWATSDELWVGGTYETA